MDEQLQKAALEYHQFPVPGKISIAPTKTLISQRDLSLAYSPGVAAACNAIAADPNTARDYTARGNLVAVITNGTAVLGLGNIGPLAGKPVMEGKGVLFKKFAGIDVFDIELAEHDPDKLVDIVAALEPTFGGVNLEDIKAPECFYIEKKLRERMKIPVFHDDQHGTAIITAAAILNGLEIVGKTIADVKLVCSGAGAAAIACLDLLVGLGLDPKKILALDSKGVLHKGRDLDPSKAKYARETNARTLLDAIDGADIFLGLSGPGVMTQEMVKKMARAPLILALANPEPEIRPEKVREVRDDALIATGRSDYPNQVNNVLCFPFMFRGALDVGATSITPEMQMACVRALAELARAEPTAELALAYGDEQLSFGPDYLIPKPFDPRLILRVAPAVAKAAVESGVATRPIQDFEAYRQRLLQFVYHSGLMMKPLFDAAKASPKRVVYCEGEEERVLRAVQNVIDEGMARPILVGRPDVIQNRITRLGLRIRPDKDFEMINIASDPRHLEYSERYRQLMGREGVSPAQAKFQMRNSSTLIGAMLLKDRTADAMLCGTYGRYRDHLSVVSHIIGLRRDVAGFAAMNALILPKRTLFVADTYVNTEPSSEQLAEIAVMAAEEIKRFGIEPKVALLSHSNFGSDDSAHSRRMRTALELIRKRAPHLEVDGEMQADSALDTAIRHRALPDSLLKGPANLLIMPNLDAANIAFNLLKTVSGDGLTVGPMLLGAAQSVHIITPSATVRRIVNMTALVVAEAGGR
jgi:malate dehydrogenase (oxaloacetate-decarboxylating)(NADP+)